MLGRGQEQRSTLQISKQAHFRYSRLRGLAEEATH